MLVKKKNPSWEPSENKYLKVGETVEISDPKSLILHGDAIGIASDGITELSAFDLYNVIIADEAEEFKQYLQTKKAEAAKTALEAEKKSLEKTLAASEAESKPVVETVVAPVTVAPVVKPTAKKN